MEEIVGRANQLNLNSDAYDIHNDLWNENASELEVFLKSQRHHDRDVLPVSTDKIIEKAERLRTKTSKIYGLHVVNLNETKSVEVNEDMPYRMWYPLTDSWRLSNNKIRPRKSLITDARSVILKKVPNDPDVTDEVKMRDQRLCSDIVLAPTLRRRLIRRIRKKYKVCSNGSYKVDDLDCFARAEVNSTDNDVFRQCSVYYPDMNYKRESSALRDALMSKLSDPRQNSKLEVAVPVFFFHVAIGDGGSCEILWNDMTHSLLVNIAVNQNITEYVKWYFPRSIYAVRLTASERVKLSKYLNKNKAEVFENAVRVYFASWEDCCEAVKYKDNRVARIFPRAFIIGDDVWNSVKNAKMTYRVKWFKYPAKSVGIVILQDLRDQVLARRVLFYHGYSVEFYSDLKTIKIVLNAVPACFQHDAVFESHVREILSKNDITIERAYLKRSRKQLNNMDETVRRKVFRSIVEELIRKGQWRGHHPVTFHDWLQLLSDNFPWQWRLLDNRYNDDYSMRNMVGEAELLFNDADYGLRMLDVLVNNEQELRIWNGVDDPQRIIMKPVYCVSLSVTKEVRVACDKFIRNLNKEESAIAEGSGNFLNSLEIVDKTWTVFYDASDDTDTSEGEIAVQGWPIQHVEEVATRLISAFQGSYVDCSDVDHGRLLYGYGSRYVEFVRKKLRGQVVIDVDLLGERITVVGEAADLAIRKLKFFAENSHAFALNERIEITPPSYLYSMRNVLKFIGINAIREMCGGAELRTRDFVTIDFTGTLQQYELLMSCLQEIDEKLIPSISKVSNSSRPACPLCQSPVNNAFYCLECGHYYCLKCIIYQIKTVTQSRLLPLCCVDENCGKPFAISDIERIVLGDARLPWLNEKKIRLLLESSIDCLIRKEKSLFRCPTPDCTGIFTKNATDQPTTVRCDSCRRERCNACFMEPHEGVSCDDHAVLRSDHEASLRAYKESHVGTVRECPSEGCGAVIEKNEGCNHMHCSMCNIHFCWLCNFKDSSQSNVYKHLRENHGALGNQWLFLEEEHRENVPLGMVDEHEEGFRDHIDVDFPVVYLVADPN